MPTIPYVSFLLASLTSLRQPSSEDFGVTTDYSEDFFEDIVMAADLEDFEDFGGVVVDESRIASCKRDRDCSG